MAVYYPVGRALVTFDELLEKSASGELQKFAKALGARKDARIEFRSGSADAASLEAMRVLPSPSTGNIVPWKELGLNRPLAIEIRHVYTGNSPDGKDMLVTSAVKGMTTYEAAPRAVNQLSPRVPRNSGFDSVPATQKGTYLVFYSPAVLETHASLTLEIGFDKFHQDVFDTVGSAFGKAAAIPLFVPYSGLLVAAGMVTKLIGKIGESLTDTSPYFNEPVSIDLYRPGVGIPEPGLRVITKSSFPEEELSRYQYAPGRGLVDATGRSYAGPHPYVIISLDGTTNEQYRAFTPTAASAALLERFYKAREGAEIGSEMLMDAVKLYTDWQFRTAADKVAAQMKTAAPDSKEHEELEARLGSLVDSIVTPELKPKTA